MKNPCYDKHTNTKCPRRSAGCQLNCPEWAEYEEERDRVRKKRNMSSEVNAIMRDLKNDRVYAYQRKQTRSRRGSGR